ncbi:Peptidase inhibitor 16 [Fasciola hepatica]|uniref:Peptidase inhibitor 16 n=2 Tax=Fasciola hepatica TaxID=6192 RepID=A0A4E0RMR8_FASHE|nr:Peptidase inhibitor 16 [Fasciola hepatica]
MGDRGFSYILRVVTLLTLYHISMSTTRVERRRFVDEHNKYRTMLMAGKVSGQPRASSMKMLTWDEELARKAQFLANKCQVGHDTLMERQTKEFHWVGQNWAGTFNVSDTVRLWFEEHRHYSFEKNSCKPGRMCGHYTQVVWASTRKVGCGYRKCPGRAFPYGYSVVCNYGPGGNFLGAKPYRRA